MIARSRGNDTATTRLRFAGNVDQHHGVRTGAAGVLGGRRRRCWRWPRRASPCRRSGSPRRRTARRGRRCRMNPGRVRLRCSSCAFFDALHCHAPPVITSASSAINATIERPAINIGRAMALSLLSRRLRVDPRARQGGGVVRSRARAVAGSTVVCRGRRRPRRILRWMASRSGSSSSESAGLARSRCRSRRRCRRRARRSRALLPFPVFLGGMVMSGPLGEGWRRVWRSGRRRSGRRRRGSRPSCRRWRVLGVGLLRPGRRRCRARRPTEPLG